MGGQSPTHRAGALRRQGLRDLFIGQGISALGDWMGTVAFMGLVLAITKQSLTVGGILVLRLAPAGVAGPLAARLVTRWNRRRTMIVMDLIRVGVVAVVPLVGALWWIYLWAFLLEGQAWCSCRPVTPLSPIWSRRRTCPSPTGSCWGPPTG